jgi:4-amino-4-deoxy-L-arabinose transferase-like glycosyltransferase
MMKALPQKTLSQIPDQRFRKLAIHNHWVAIFALLLVCLATLWLGLNASRLWDRDEPRNARCAVEMLDRADWVVPMFNDQLRTHKPILLYWLQMASIRALGETDFAARTASAMMATLAVLATYWLGKNLIDTTTGFWSAAALGSSLMFIVAGRAATPDACLIATSTIGIVGLVLHWQTESKQFTRYAWLGYIALGLAILAKGPVGIVLPMIVSCLWAMIRQSIDKASIETSRISDIRLRWHSICNACLQLAYLSWRTARRLLVFRGLALALLVAAPWYIWVGIRTDGAWLYGFFFEHNLGRAMSAMEGHRGGLWFYPAASLVGLFPWSLMLLPIAFWVWEQRRDTKYAPAIQLGLIWLGVYIALFSIARTKLPSYITPSYPGAALLVGGFLSQWADRKHRLSSRWLTIAASVFALVGCCVIAAIAFLSFRENMPRILPHAGWGISFLIVAIALLAAVRFEIQHRLPWAMLASSSIFLCGLFTSASPTVGLYRNDLTAILSEANFVDASGKQMPTQWVSLRSIEPSWIYYLKSPIKELPKLDLSQETYDTQSLHAIAACLQKPSGRLIVDAMMAPKVEQILSDRYQLQIDRAVSFKSFLKSNNEVVVLRSRTTNEAHRFSRILDEKSGSSR